MQYIPLLKDVLRVNEMVRFTRGNPENQYIPKSVS